MKPPLMSLAVWGEVTVGSISWYVFALNYLETRWGRPAAKTRIADEAEGMAR